MTPRNTNALLASLRCVQTSYGQRDTEDVNERVVHGGRLSACEVHLIEVALGHDLEGSPEW